MRRNVLTALALFAGFQALLSASGPLTLELRVFDGPDEVTGFTRITVHAAGDRGDPIARRPPRGSPMQVEVPEGIYDVQAILERDGQVENIRWANRLVVMPYPDEKGRHLEVVNFRNGFGALQIRGAAGPAPNLALYPSGERKQAAAHPIPGSDYVLFVVAAGRYDLQVQLDGKVAWHTDIDVPLDRTRFWMLP